MLDKSVEKMYFSAFKGGGGSAKIFKGGNTIKGGARTALEGMFSLIATKWDQVTKLPN